MAECQGCGAATGSQSYLCPTCGDQLRRTLLMVAALAPDLDAAVARLTQRAGTPGRSQAAGLPFDERAAQAAARLRWVLARWSKIFPEAS